MDITEEAQQNVRDILQKNYHLNSKQFVLVLYDTQSTLVKILTAAYTRAISSNPHKLIDFESKTEESILTEFELLPPKSLVILLQSTSFRMSKHRLRADLFRRGHQVIEHARLGYNTDEQIENYIHSLKYDSLYYVATTNAIEQLLKESGYLLIQSGEDQSGEDKKLEVCSVFEKPIKNTGDFTNVENISAGFPIGEIFTEAVELDKINGEVVVFGFPGLDHRTHFTNPFTVKIENGCVVSHTGPPEFEEIMQLICTEEVNHAVQVREIGFGLNRQLGFNHRLNEPTAFERFAGMHFSLGLKHAMYGKKLGRKVFQKYHIDIFCLVKRVVIGEREVFRDGKYVV